MDTGKDQSAAAGSGDGRVVASRGDWLASNRGGEGV